MEGLFAWQIGGAVVCPAACLIVAIQLEGHQLKRWAIVLVLAATGLVAIPIVQQNASGGDEADTQLDATLPNRTTTDPIDTDQNL